MKALLLCATPEFTGPAELLLEDAALLREAGHEVTIAFDTRRAGTLREHVRRARLPIAEELELCRIPNPAAIVRDVRALRASLQSGRYDTIHARFSHDHHLALLAAAGLERRGLRLIRSCELLHNADRGLARSLAYAATDHFLVASSEHARTLAARHAIPGDRITTIPGRVDPARFTPGRSHLRGELGIPESAPVLGIVSRIKPDRLHLALLAAFARAAPFLPDDAVLVVIGRGEGEPALRAAVERAGLSARVRFAGYRSGDALVDAYRALDVKAWLAPGNDGSCRAVLEAMACGCAILGGAFGAVADAVRDEETGRLCDPNEPEDLAALILELLSDRRRTRALGEAGRRRVVRTYVPEGRRAAVLTFYERVWASPPVRSSHHLA